MVFLESNTYINLYHLQKKQEGRSLKAHALRDRQGAQRKLTASNSSSSLAQEDIYVEPGQPTTEGIT